MDQSLAELRTASGPTAGSARGLLLTILGEFVLPSGGSAWTQTLVEAMARVGIRDKAARQTIARMHDQGWLERTRVGRQTRWALSPSARTILDEGARRIYGFGRDAPTWDGSWLLLLASVPETERNLRYRMNLGLSWAGFGSLGQGTWVTPWVARETPAVILLDELGVDATSFVARLGQLGDGRQVAARAWDLPTLHDAYEDFRRDTDDTGAPPVEGPDAVRDLTTLVHRWRQFPFVDPGLPNSLLPDDWPGPLATRRFAELRRNLGPPATTWWEDTEARFTPDR